MIHTVPNGLAIPHNHDLCLLQHCSFSDVNKNYRNIILRPDTQGETVGVRLKSRDVRYVRWLGLISRDDAREQEFARPVKLEVHSYQIDSGTWVELEEGQFLQGCLIVGAGVYWIIHDAHPKVI